MHDATFLLPRNVVRDMPEPPPSIGVLNCYPNVFCLFSDEKKIKNYKSKMAKELNKKNVVLQTPALNNVGAREAGTFMAI